VYLSLNVPLIHRLDQFPVELINRCPQLILLFFLMSHLILQGASYLHLYKIPVPQRKQYSLVHITNRVVCRQQIFVSGYTLPIAYLPHFGWLVMFAVWRKQNLKYRLYLIAWLTDDKLVSWPLFPVHES